MGGNLYVWTCKADGCDEQGKEPRAVAINRANAHVLKTGHHVECVEVR